MFNFLFRNHLLFILIIILYNLQAVNNLAVDSNDLLSGSGLFSSQSISGFVLNSTHTTNFVTSGSTNILVLTKSATSAISFTDGLSYTFTRGYPKHIEFEFSSNTVDQEDTNLRIKDSITGLTLISFRAGNSGLIRVNENQMVGFYNNSVSTDTSIITTKMDLLIDWNYRTISVYCNQTYKGNVAFYHENVGSVDTLLLYNLNPGVGYWKNIVVCSSNCYGFSFGQNILIMISMLIVLTICLF